MKLNFESGWVSTRADESESIDWYYALNAFQYSVRSVSGFDGRGGYKVDVVKAYNWGVPSEPRNDLSHSVGPISVHLKQPEIAHVHTIGMARDYYVVGSTYIWN